jgi:ferredoxin
MRVRPDKAKCAGHAQCYAVDARLFPIDEMGYSTVTVFDVHPTDEETARSGVAACPERALFLDGDETHSE